MTWNRQNLKFSFLEYITFFSATRSLRNPHYSLPQQCFFLKFTWKLCRELYVWYSSTELHSNSWPLESSSGSSVDLELTYVVHKALSFSYHAASASGCLVNYRNVLNAEKQLVTWFSACMACMCLPHHFPLYLPWWVSYWAQSFWWSSWLAFPGGPCVCLLWGWDSRQATGFLCGCWNPNSSPHAWEASTLFTESFPQAELTF